MGGAGLCVQKVEKGNTAVTTIPTQGNYFYSSAPLLYSAKLCHLPFKIEALLRLAAAIRCSLNVAMSNPFLIARSKYEALQPESSCLRAKAKISLTILSGGSCSTIIGNSVSNAIKRTQLSSPIRFLRSATNNTLQTSKG